MKACPAVHWRGKRRTSMQYIRLIRSNRDFARLWAAQLVSLLGDWFSTIVISALIVSYTEGTGYQGIAVSGFLIARMIPPLLMRPLAGVLADRFDRKGLLIISDLLRALVVLGLLFTTQSPDYLPLIYVFVVLQFLVSSIFEPARNAIMPSILYRHQLVIGNTLSSITWSAMLAVGAIAGGLVAQAFGTQIALVIDALTFVLSALLVATVVVPEVPRSELGQPPRKAQDKSQRTFADGLRYLWRNPQTAAALFVKSGQSITSSDTLLIIYGTQVFVVGEQGVASMALLWAAFGVGAVVGPLLTNRFSDDSVPVLRRLISVGFALIVLGWLLWGLAPSLELLALAVVVRAMGGSVNWTYSSVIIQQIVPDDYLGRVFSLDFAGFEFVQSISILAFGLLIDAAGGDTIAHIVYLSALVAVLPLLMWVGVVRGIEKRESAEAVNGEF
ncbi:MAG: MFS transporter [Chloroflexi bacterium]|nr:MFS transporter [Chloroflexota bacterium]MYA92144.1 MFS transporter [Chloroflexota bacterium]MYD39553.1 MFS transporter [Chloroflexota bacterium]MYE77462.1 MFS transporter [Chloroflexota bacterium]MYH66379.1 MFS transporter [Chloroflexota bacterium]